MHRIDAEGHQNYKFFDGDSTGVQVIPATVIPAEWLNAVQEAICKLIESRGTSPTKGDDEQLVRLIGEPLSAMEKEIEHLREEVAKLWTKIG